MGRSVSGLGDLNGDGIKDFVSGAPGYQVGSGFSATSVVEAGAALVFFGSNDVAERGVPDIIFTGVGSHDRVGVSVAGDFDFNGDGVKDIVIGAEQVDRTTDPNNPTPTGNGKVYLIFFDPNDTTHYPNIGNPTVVDTVSLSLVGQPGGIPGVVFEGVALGDQAGFSVAGGGRSTPGGGTDILIGEGSTRVPRTSSSTVPHCPATCRCRGSRTVFRIRSPGRPTSARPRATISDSALRSAEMWFKDKRRRPGAS
jgi:glycosylphosphatidylinositol phospholipase D